MNGVMAKPIPMLTTKFTSEAVRLMTNCLFLFICVAGQLHYNADGVAANCADCIVANLNNTVVYYTIW